MPPMVSPQRRIRRMTQHYGAPPESAPPMTSLPPTASESAQLADQVTIERAEWEALLAVATLYVGAFGDPEETMTLPERMRLQEIEDILAKHGKRY